MVEVLYNLTYYANTPLVGVGFVLIVFLAVPKLGAIARAAVASILASVVIVGPGMLYNATVGPGSEANPLIYFSLFWIPTLFVAWLASWLLERRITPDLGDTFD